MFGEVTKSQYSGTIDHGGRMQRIGIGQGTNPGNGHCDLHPRTHRQCAERGSAGDHIAGMKRHLAGDQRHDPGRRNDHVCQRIVLSHPTVQGDLDREGLPVETGGNCWPERAKTVAPLGTGPLRETGIAGEQIERGNVVHAGQAKDRSRRLSLIGMADPPPDDQAKLALVNHLAIVIGGRADRRTWSDDRVAILQEEERFFRDRITLLRGGGVKIIPQAVEGAWLHRCEKLHRSKRNAFPRWHCASKEIALMDGDRLFGQRAEARRAVSREAHPQSHV